MDIFINKKILRIIIVILFIFIIVLFCVERFGNFRYSDFILLSNYRGSFYNESNNSFVFTDYDSYKSQIDTDELKEADFRKNNYVLFSVENDSCSGRNPKPVSYNIDGDILKIIVEYEASCGVCSPLEIDYLLKVDKSITNINVDIDYKAINKPHCDQAIAYKPMIYLYPEEETNVEVKLGYPELLTTTYPKYKDSWKVLAKPDGTLIDKNGREYYGLYWEGKTAKNKKFSDGFVVKGKDCISFLEEKLFMLGLNEREANEFIVYWLPKLEKNKYNLIRFEEEKIIDNEMPLEINPRPDTVIRVLMKYKPLNKKINIKEQKLETPSRAGFTVVEWGGTIVKTN